MNALEQARANMQAAKDAKATSQEQPEQKVVVQKATIVPAANKKEKVFNIYRSTMQAHKLIRPDGKVIHVTNFQYVTDDKLDIAYLDNEISLGFPYLKAAEQVTSTDLDPVAAFRKQIAEEAVAAYKEQLVKEVTEGPKDMGASAAVTLMPAGTDAMGGNASESNSTPS